MRPGGLRDPDVRDRDVKDPGIQDHDVRDPDIQDPGIRGHDVRDPDTGGKYEVRERRGTDRG
ncbi:hypothetical protein GCM10009548_29640 [Streptomyces malaysiensis subsp. malaysiensis]|uniref:Uncharacterized protein n=1 Tax=Streptomyces malaysiensis TaxID=92644 RepID=A0ABX6WER5_STRMQ|nr:MULTISPECIES: hypothetical protein [Streptomyces]QPI59908.1 hypothetical protein I1A49_37960 [Streptomyces solisilvae]UHH21588.1 hypothetical protein LUV23_38105 [Streptomyces sp. HNM0561]